MSIGEIIKAGITAGNTTDEILAAVLKAHPDANTKAASVAWYRSQMKKGTTDSKPKVKASVKAVASTVKQQEISSHVYEVRGIKTFKSEDGLGYNANLYCDGMKVAEVRDSANGQPLHINWVDSDKNAVVHTVNYKDEPHKYDGTPFEAALAAHCMTLPKYKGYKDEMYYTTPDLFIDHLVNDHTLRASLKRMIKGAIAFIAKGGLYTIKCTPTPENIATIVAKEKIKSVEPIIILNNLTEVDAILALRKLQGV